MDNTNDDQNPWVFAFLILIHVHFRIDRVDFLGRFMLNFKALQADDIFNVF
jgi:hypothetical protein